MQAVKKIKKKGIPDNQLSGAEIKFGLFSREKQTGMILRYKTKLYRPLIDGRASLSIAEIVNSSLNTALLFPQHFAFNYDFYFLLGFL